MGMMQTIPQCHSHDNSSRNTYLESMQKNEIINKKVKIFMKEAIQAVIEFIKNI